MKTYPSDFDCKHGLNMSPLKPGTVLFVETTKSVYRLQIVRGKEILITGGMLRSGEDRFPAPTTVIFYGSTWGEDALKSDWIGKDMRLRLSYIVSGQKCIFTSSPVTEIEIISPDKSWSYKMGWKGDE